jgi:hypothetical protein
VTTAAAVFAIAVPAAALSSGISLGSGIRLGAGIKLGSGIRTMFGLGRPRPVWRKAEVLVSAPVGNGFYAHLVRVPSTTGTRCALTILSRRPGRPPLWLGGGRGGVCTLRGVHRVGSADRSHPLVIAVSVRRRPVRGVRANWVPPVVTGSVYRGLHAARVRIEWRHGSYPLVLDGGYFAGGSPRLYRPPFGNFPFSVVAYDAHGHEVARKKLDSPTLRLMRHGWKQYAREYREWKRGRRR